MKERGEGLWEFHRYTYLHLLLLKPPERERGGGFGLIVAPPVVK